jgi:hypothetical protein
MPSLPLRHPSAPCVLLLLVLGLLAACDRREEGVEGDLSPETGLTTPVPQETPPSDPASGTATTEPDAAAQDDTAQDDTAQDDTAQDDTAQEPEQPAPER